MKKNIIFLLSIFSSILCTCPNIFGQKSGSEKQVKFALLIGGGAAEYESSNSYYKNIVYAANSLKYLHYKEKNIIVLFFNGKTQSHPHVDGAATKGNVLNILSSLANKLNSNNTLLFFRSGHGMVELVFEKHGILSNEEHVPENENPKVIGTAAVMCFPDGALSYLEFQKSLNSIKAKQIIVILNQCFAGQFLDIAENIENSVIISETCETEIAFKNKRKTGRWDDDVWPFVKCLFDGFTDDYPYKKKSVFQAFNYMLQCNPNIEGIPLQADRPLLKSSPQINYGSNLKQGTVYID